MSKRLIITRRDENALRSLVAAGGKEWVITMTKDYLAALHRLVKLGLVDFVHTPNRRGNLRGADAVVTAEGRALLRMLDKEDAS